MRFATLALLALQSVYALAQGGAVVEEEAEDPSSTPNLKVSASVSFPDSEVFGVKLINGRATKAVLSLHNEEPKAVTVAFIGGSLLHIGAEQPTILRNLTTQRYNVEIPAGESESLTYTFVNEMHPQDVQLNLATVLKQDESIFTLQAFNGTVSVVEAPLSILDPQIIFLYLMLAGAFSGTCYFIYITWITTLFPQMAPRGKGGDRAKRSSGGTKKVDPSEQVSVVGADGPAVTTGAKFDESWIPAGHIQRPEAKRAKSGGASTPRTKPRA